MKQYQLKRQRIDKGNEKLHILKDEIEESKDAIIIHLPKRASDKLYNWPEYWKYIADLNKRIKYGLFKKKRH